MLGARAILRGCRNIVHSRSSRMYFSRAKQPWVFLVLLFVLSLPAVTVRFYASDEIEYFAYLRSMWFDGICPSTTSIATSTTAGSHAHGVSRKHFSIRNADRASHEFRAGGLGAAMGADVRSG